MSITYNGKTVLAIYRNGTAIEQALIAWNWTPMQLYFGGIKGAAYVPDTGNVLGPLGLSALFGENIYAVYDEKNGTPTFGSNLIVNGDFSNGTTNWAVNDPNAVTITVVEGRIQVTALDTLIRWTWQSFPTVVGKTYELSFDYDSGTATGITFSAGSSYGSGDRIPTSFRTGSGTTKGLFLATSITTWITAGTSSNNAGKQVFFDNISVRERSGNPVFQNSVAGRPLLGRVPLRGKVNVLASSNPGTAPKNITGTVTTAGIRSATVVESPGGPFGRTQKKLISNAAALVGVNDHTGFSLQTAIVASPYTLSFIAKPAELDGLFIRMGNYSTSQVNVSIRLSDGVIYSGGGAFATWGGLVFKSITELTDGFKRYEYTYTIGINQTLTIRGRSVSGLVSENDGVNGIYLDMVQLEAGSTSTAYQEVTTALDTVESGVTSYPFIRMDLSDDTLTTAGLGSTKNLLRHTEEFDNTAWIKNGLLTFGSGSTANAIASPTGTITADLLTVDTSTASHRVYQLSVSTLAGNSRFSIYLKSNGIQYVTIRVETGGNYGIMVDLTTGGTSAGKYDGATTTTDFSNLSVIRDAATGWVYVSGTYTGSGSSNVFLYLTNNTTNSTYTGDGTSGIYIWGAQLEAGSVVTAYEYGGFKGTALVAGRNGTLVESVVLPDGNFTLGPTAVTSSGVPGLLRAVGDIVGYNLINKTLSAKERKYLIEYYKDRGAKGLLVPGPELVINGGFNTTDSWTGTSDWIISDGKINVNNGANGGYLGQLGVFTAGKQYSIQLDHNIQVGQIMLTTWSSGVAAGTRTFIQRNIAGSATYRTVFIATYNGSFVIGTENTAVTTCSIDNVSIKELRPEEEWV